jgi:hypothetical protein
MKRSRFSEERIASTATGRIGYVARRQIGAFETTKCTSKEKLVNLRGNRAEASEDSGGA